MHTVKNEYDNFVTKPLKFSNDCHKAEILFSCLVIKSCLDESDRLIAPATAIESPT